MKKVNFSFINDNGQKKNGYVWVDEGTYKMLPQLDEVKRIEYLREIYYEQIKESKYKRRISSLEEICKPKKNEKNEDITFEFQDTLNIEADVLTEIKVRQVLEEFTEFEKEMIREILIKKVSTVDYAAKVGLAQQNISRKIVRIRKKLQKINVFFE